MKLSPLLAQYLSTHKVLPLPGLGVFTINSIATAVADADNTSIHPLIHFEEKKSTVVDENLIDFLSTETGKMKVLASSDLQSQIENALLLLNSGKPYHIRGIGTLVRKPYSAILDFAPETTTPSKEKRKESAANERNKIPQTYIDSSRPAVNKTNKAAILVFILVLVAIAATVWFYLKSNPSDNEVAEAIPTTNANGLPATTHTTPATNAAQQDSTSVAANTGTAATYTYVLEIAARPRAEKRFAQLKKIQWPVELKTSDSLTFKIVMRLPAAQADTVRIKDSLSRLSGKKVFIER